MDPFRDTYDGLPYQHIWTRPNQDEPAGTAIDSPLLALAFSSDVDPIQAEQVTEARHILRRRRALTEAGGTDPALIAEVLAGQRAIVERFLAGRRAHFGAEQSAPLPDPAQLAREGRDIFLVIKFMDEAPHLAATLHSLTAQRGVDLGRLMIVAVDNNSTDGSGTITEEFIAAYTGPARLYYLRQTTAGAGNAARFGVDTCIATVHAMCEADGDWSRLQTATIAVSDGDTVYHPDTVAAVSRIFTECPTVDGVMPFLTYKFTAALRLFHDYHAALPQTLAAAAAKTGEPAEPVTVAVDLSGVQAFEALPRRGRVPGDGVVTLTHADGGTTVVPLAHTAGDGRRFGVLRDPHGRLGYVLQDRTLVLADAPVSGWDAALVFLENGGVRPDERWRWHSVIGHDLFLYWAFAGMGLPEQMVYPDTSDALKTFRVWAFAIGGQHQLRRPGLRIVTGSDYQSGRVLQAVGAVSRLAPAVAFTETETDRLIKMIRNFVHRQSVFYGETRSAALERASGLYVHMTRIQGDLERELRDYDDTVFEHTVFPERVLFPLRWMLQNALRYLAQGDAERAVVRMRVLRPLFGDELAADIERRLLGEDFASALAAAKYHDRQAIAERTAEAIIGEHYHSIMAFYAATLRSFLSREQVAPEHYEWLLEGITTSRNAITEQPPAVDPAAVWDGREFDIDVARGQVVRMQTPAGA
ncbi:glycosyltransferase family 2 protein [Dactylosporangium vinaceum]|uniref:Glycosyltransferase family A protein n=1 Tax=Dactylosporangium vinaceum TaxID=53362 RepID=A0ABV5MS75_9ACTN|nr:glycosyltransferase family A protein [Dactylosporangium vinaceum]UAC00214.1 glycosyltransferase family 2 protein [Dactylosporangium vinaceum]